MLGYVNTSSRPVGPTSETVPPVGNGRNSDPLNSYQTIKHWPAGAMPLNGSVASPLKRSQYSSSMSIAAAVQLHTSTPRSRSFTSPSPFQSAFGLAMISEITSAGTGVGVAVGAGGVKAPVGVAVGVAVQVGVLVGVATSVGVAVNVGVAVGGTSPRNDSASTGRMFCASVDHQFVNVKHWPAMFGSQSGSSFSRRSSTPSAISRLTISITLKTSPPPRLTPASIVVTSSTGPTSPAPLAPGSSHVFHVTPSSFTSVSTSRTPIC